MDINIDICFDRRHYFGVSDTSLEIYDEETRVICLWQAIESNNLKKQTAQNYKKQNDLNKQQILSLIC